MTALNKYRKLLMCVYVCVCACCVVIKKLLFLLLFYLCHISSKFFSLSLKSVTCFSFFVIMFSWASFFLFKTAANLILCSSCLCSCTFSSMSCSGGEGHVEKRSWETHIHMYPHYIMLHMFSIIHVKCYCTM